MVKNKITFILLTLLLIVLTINLSSAWIVPDTHDYISRQALLKSGDSTYGKIISENYEDFSACNSLTDYSVFLYFNEGFSTIGKVYLASHNNIICSRAIELANKNNPSEMACAIGICSMDAEDVASHNKFIPEVITKSGLVNGLVHAPAEECVNKKITTSQLQSEGRSAIVNKYPIHRAYLIKVFQSDSRASTINVGTMMDAFVKEVGSSKEYTVGFRGFTAIPTSIHLIILLFFLAGIVGLIFFHFHF